MSTTASLLSSVRAMGDGPTPQAVAEALMNAGWPTDSLDLNLSESGVLVATLAGQPKMLVLSGGSDVAEEISSGATLSRPMSMGYSSEAPYTFVWTPDLLELHQTTYWSKAPGDAPLIRDTDVSAAATANILQLVSPKSIVNNEPAAFRSEFGRSQPDLAQTLGQALADLRAAIVAENVLDDETAHNDLRVMRLFHQLLFIRFIEDRHPDRAVDRVESALEAADPSAALAKTLRHYARSLQSELFTRDAVPIESVPPKALRRTIVALTEPWARLRLDFELTPNDVSGRLYESYLGRRPAVDRDPNALFPVVTETDDRSQRASFYTPTAVATELARATLLPWLNENEPEAPDKIRVVDPACGSGAFLLASYRILRDYFEAKKGAPLSQRERRDLLARSIFGADQDESALMLAQVALYEEADLGADSSLPAMGKNLLQGDSLLSPPGGPENGGVAWNSAIRAAKFQVVLTNPPFGAQKTRAARSTEQYRKLIRGAYPEAHEWGADIAYYFLALSIRLLDETGMAGLVLPRKILTGTTASRARRILNECGVRLVQDYRGARLFPSVSAYVALVTIGGQPTDSVHVEEPVDSRLPVSLLLDPSTRDDWVRKNRVDRSALEGSASWSAFELRWSGLKAGLRSGWTELGAAEGVIVASGIQSGDNDRFVLVPERVASRFVTVRGLRVPRRYCPRFVKGPEVLPFRLAPSSGARIVLPFGPGSEEGRAVEAAVAALGGPAKNTQLGGKIETWLGPKVLVRAFGMEPAAALDEDGDVVAPKGTAGAFAIGQVGASPEKLRGMVGYLNSALAQWWLRGAGEPKGDETVEVLEGQLRRLPWPELDDDGWRKIGEAAVSVLTSLSVQSSSQRTSEWWSARRRLDELVFELMGVDPDLRSLIRYEVVRRG